MPTKQQSLLAVMVAVVTTAHLWLLAAGSGTGGVGHGLTWQQGGARAMLPPTPSSPPTWQVRQVSLARPSSPSAPASASPTSPEPTEPTEPVTTADPPMNAAQQTSGGFNDYLPRHLLTVGPRPETPVIIDYPAHWSLPGRRSGRLAIYIDEHGTVRRVEALDSALVPAMVEAARSAFLSARFLPGERSGQAVRTRMEVEVDFDAGP